MAPAAPDRNRPAFGTTAPNASIPHVLNLCATPAFPPGAYPSLVSTKLARWTARGALCFAATLTLAGCGFFASGPDYPAELPVPPSATKVVSDTGSDNDEPMRSRQQVLDMPGVDAHDLLAFYQDAFPETHGWSAKSVAEGQLVCLSRQSEEGFFEFVEVFTYQGSRVDQRPDRFLSMASRFQDPTECGSAFPWVPSDLIE